MVRSLGVFGVVLALACAGGDPPEPVPAPTEPAPEAPAPPPPAAPGADEVEWPRVTLGAVPAGRTAPIPAGHAVLDLDLDPRGRFAVIVTGQGDSRAAWTWDFAGPLVPVAAPGVEEVALSSFDDTAYVLARSGEGWTLDRGALGAGGGWVPAGRVYASEGRLSSLSAPFTRWDGEERVFFAREASPGIVQVLGARRSGAQVYEVTSPTGVLGALTADEVRTPPDAWRSPPNVLRADAATPLSVHPVTGALLWRDGAGAVHRRAWDQPTANWGEDQVVAPDGHQTWSPNGWYAVVWRPGQAGAALRDPAGAEVAVPGPVFRGPPAMSADGRTLLAWTDEGVRTVGVTAPLAPVRYLAQAASTPEEVAALARSGMHVGDTVHTQLYQVYDELLYAAEPPPVFASLDGMLEVLHVGFQAVFVQVEREVSRPRLDAFLVALEAAGARADERRVREIAALSRRMLAGDYAFPEGERVLAEGMADSELHRVPVDFGDFHPRGPYATSPDLANYFRAFKYVDLLQLDDAERAAIGEDPALVAAWRAWIDAQSPYLSGTRYEGMFGSWTKSPHARPECTPTRIVERPRRVFPLSWGRDAEILERVTAHDDLAPECTVPLRVFPSGLDLLAGLGSDGARARLRGEYARHPALEGAHDALRARFGGPVDTERFVDAWLRLVQILGTDARVPEGVDPDRWRARLWETALASWASLRHTTVLVNESSAAQMGAGAEDGFEWRTAEPVRGVVDPVPEAWRQLADLLDRIAAHATAAKVPGRVPVVLGEGAANTRRLGALAERQMRGEPLGEEDYDFIASFAGTVEHPYLLLSAAAAGKEMEISAPDPMMRIVDVHTWNDPEGAPKHWHVAVGRPRRLVALVGDRGILVPGHGAVYAYHEVVSEQRLDDAAWRESVDRAARPGWANRSDPLPPRP